jgi:hypothetical protein
MENKHVTRFGNPNTASGARYLVFDVEGLQQVAIDLEYARLIKEGVPLVPKIKSLVKDTVKRDFEVLASKIRAEGTPQKIVDLFSFTKKGKAEKYAKNIKILEFELFLLIHNSQQLGYRHKSKLLEHIPSQLQIGEEDVGNLFKTDKSKLAKRIVAAHKQRKRMHAHLFEKDSDWHCFYFSYDDVEEGENHFVQGTHLHYLSHLWTYNKEVIWSSFDARITNIKDIHIKFEPFQFLEIEKIDRDLLVKMENRPMLIAINPDLPSTYETTAIPLAQIITRGVWMADVSAGRNRGEC